MAIGLSRSLNLSETNLNLKEAIQKLYAPGIQDDIDLFSLSSQITSNIVSGPETDKNSQIIGLRNETLRNPDGTVVKRTRFLTKTNTYSVGDKVWFNKYTPPLSSGADVINPVFSNNGSIPATNIIYSGRGYYFKEPSLAGETVAKRFAMDPVIIEGVVIEGDISKSTSARATITFKPEPSTIFATSDVATWSEPGLSGNVLAGAVSTVQGGNNTLVVNANGSWSYVSTNLVQLATNLRIEVTYVNGVTATYTILTSDQSAINSTGSIDLAPIGSSEQLDYLTKWTGFYTKRFYVDSIVLTNSGSGYLIGEKLNIQTETTVTEQSDSVSCVIDRQVGKEYFGYEAIIYADYYKYDVRSSSQSGFYLSDPVVNKFMFLDLEKDEDDFNTIGAREIRIFRNDAVYVNNILQLRFAQSRVYHSSYTDPFSSGGNIAGSVKTLTSTADGLRSNSFRSIQNTKNPEEVTSDENTLGFRYNRILGNDMPVYQRVVIRDQDFVLGSSEVTGNRLKTDVQMTQFRLAGTSIRVPGLFIKVGAEYKRAFSTRDKPFLQVNESGPGVVNPAVIGPYTHGQYSLFAANRYSGSWYGYNTVLSKFAQRISIPSTTADIGKNGALYFHKNVAPVTSVVNAGTSDEYYEVPLFTFVG